MLRKNRLNAFADCFYARSFSSAILKEVRFAIDSFAVFFLAGAHAQEIVDDFSTPCAFFS
jgi:hypothetical protein